MKLLRAGFVGLLVLSAGCAPALREPPDLEELSGDYPASAGEVDELLRLAEARFAERRAGSVREAAQLWTRAFRAAPERLEALAGAVRARIWLADHEAEPEVRRRESTVAVQTAQWCARLVADHPACDYWLGAALGVQARERRATALDALDRIVELFRRAARGDPELDRAGPDRALALLHLRAPGWPSGPGDPDLGLEHARKAVALRPDFPPNQLALAEALGETGEPDGSREAYDRALELARALEGAGDPDAGEWVREAREGLQALRSR